MTLCSSSGQLWLNSALTRDFTPFLFSILLSVTLHSWSKVHFLSSSSQQSKSQNVNTQQWRSPPWIAAAVMLIHRREGISRFFRTKSLKNYLSELFSGQFDSDSSPESDATLVFNPPEGLALHLSSSYSYLTSVFCVFFLFLTQRLLAAEITKCAFNYKFSLFLCINVVIFAIMWIVTTLQYQMLTIFPLPVQ